MTKIRVLNLYAGIGGNRKLWENVDVVAVEWDKEILQVYQENFPNDKVVVADAHEFLLQNFGRFDFIWSSPPCPSHSMFRKNVAYNVDKSSSGGRWAKAIFPDMRLYEEILFLQHYFRGKWVVENVISYYEPLIKPKRIGRHYFWSNFSLTDRKFPSGDIARGNVKEWENNIGISIRKYKINKRKDQIMANCVHPKLGLHIFNCAWRDKQKTLKCM